MADLGEEGSLSGLEQEEDGGMEGRSQGGAPASSGGVQIEHPQACMADAGEEEGSPSVLEEQQEQDGGVEGRSQGATPAPTSGGVQIEHPWARVADQGEEERLPSGLEEQKEQDGGVEGRSQGALPTSSGHKRLRSMRFIGVNWNEDRSLWRVQLTDPQTKRQRHIGYFASEEDAARAYDCAAVHASGPGAERNFPGEAASKLPAAVGEEQKQGRSSRFIGVLWHKASSSWQVKLRDPLTKRQGHVGTYAYEEDAARAYFSAAVQANGPGAERNFPGEAANGLPVPVGTEQKQRGSSRFIGVCWHKASSSWQVKLRDPQTKRQQHIGTYASEEDAAHAYDRAAVQAHGPGAMRNFLGEAINEVPA